MTKDSTQGQRLFRKMLGVYHARKPIPTLPKPGITLQTKFRFQAKLARSKGRGKLWYPKKAKTCLEQIETNPLLRLSARPSHAPSPGPPTLKRDCEYAPPSSNRIGCRLHGSVLTGTDGEVELGLGREVKTICDSTQQGENMLLSAVCAKRWRQWNVCLVSQQCTKISSTKREKNNNRNNHKKRGATIEYHNKATT